MRRLLLCGEEQRGDDAAAHLARGLLSPASVVGVDVRVVGGIDVEDLLGLEGGDCVIADTITGAAAGTVWVRDLADLARGEFGGRHSTHALPLPEVLALAETLNGAPVTGTFVGLAGERFELGAAPSPAVRAGMSRFVAAIEEALRAPVARVEGAG